LSAKRGKNQRVLVCCEKQWSEMNIDKGLGSFALHLIALKSRKLHLVRPKTGYRYGAFDVCGLGLQRLKFEVT